MLISVIIPVFNVEMYLDDCLQSVLNQTYDDFEVILINDGSTDSSGDMCDKWARKDRRIKVIHQENKGPMLARCVAMNEASGDLLYFLDSDDYIDSNLFSDCIDTFKKYDIDIVVFGVNKVINGRKSKAYNTKDFGLTTNIVALTELMKGGISDYYCNKMYKKHVFKDVVFPIGYHFEDLGSMYKILLNARNIYFINKSY